MAVLALKSTEVTKADAKLSENRQEWPAEGGKIRLAHFTVPALAALADIGSTIRLCHLPPGRVRILPSLSRFSCSAYGAARTLSFGIEAYVASDGKTAVAAIANDLANAIDVSAALSAAVLGTTIKKDYFSAKGIDVNCTNAGGTIPAGGTLEGFIAYEIVQ